METIFNMEIYTDGSCIGNPGPGSWAFIHNSSEEQEKFVGYYGLSDPTTNNRMEMQALIQALVFILNHAVANATIYIDSTYVRSGLLHWMNNWKKNHWNTSNKQPVKNMDLWQQLDHLYHSIIDTCKYNIKLEWIKGHHISIGNNIVDKLAQCSVNKHISHKNQPCKCQQDKNLIQSTQLNI